MEDESGLIKLFTSLVLLLTLSSQAHVLRVRVAVPDGTGAPIPLPRVVLLVSDNPASSEPRRVRTDANGVIDVTNNAAADNVRIVDSFMNEAVVNL